MHQHSNDYILHSEAHTVNGNIMVIKDIVVIQTVQGQSKDY